MTPVPGITRMLAHLSLDCVCGTTFVAPDGARSAVCPQCKRVGVIEFPAEYLVVAGEHEREVKPC